MLNDSENEEHIFQHKWIAFHLSSYDLTPPSERIPLTPLDDTLCSVCEHPIDEGRFVSYTRVFRLEYH